MLIDGHVHYDISGDPLKILKAMDITNTDFACLESQIMTNKINQNFDCLYAKLICGKRLYIDLSLDSYLYLHQDKMNEMPNYIKRMIDLGFDGIKMIEGKPTTRKEFPIPNFDDPLFDATFKYIEENKINITWHVNDPEEFWSDELVPDWARRSGWFYGDSTYVNNMDQYVQVENVLKKHPNLYITFAHFYFLSNDLKELSRLFETYPNISVDITPGIELFTNLSKNINDAKAFFNKYADRILYGTDISIEKSEPNDLNENDAITRHNLCHDFLTKEKTILKGDKNSLLGKDDLILNCLNLSNDKVELIEYKNFLSRYKQNRDLNKGLILKEIKIHKEKLDELKLDSSYLIKIEEAFSK